MGYKVFAACGTSSLVRSIEEILAMAEDEFSLTAVTSTDDIFRSITTFSPDIILYDVLFADGAGADLLSILKVDPSTWDIPIVAIADFLQPEKIQALFHAGADDFIGLPLSPTELIQRLMVGIQKGRLMEKLKVQSDQLQDISLAASQAGSSIIIINDRGQIVWVNEGFKRLYECSLEEFLRIFGSNLFSPEINPVTYEAMMRCKESCEYVVYDSVWVTPGGATKYIQTSLTPIYDSFYNFSKIIAIESDITDLKNTEKELGEKNDHLLTITENLEDANTMLELQRKEIEAQKVAIEEEKAKSEELLRNILPWEVARSLQKKGVYKPKKFKEVSVMFTDFVGFSKISTAYDDIDEFLEVLGSYFEAFDEITSQRFIEKIKTIGDSYMCVGGLPRTNRSHPFDTVLAALEIQRLASQKSAIAQREGKPEWQLRIGIHTGSVIAGVIGKKKFAYDIWGDTVNIASRMETASEAGKVNISETTYQYLKDYFECVYRGRIPAKNIGEINMYYVQRIKPEYSEDVEGFVPNAAFRKVLSSF